LGVELNPINGINTIFFDLDGTLRENRPSFNQAFISYVQELGLPDEAENRRQAHRWLHYYWAQSPELINDLETFETYDDPFWTNHARKYLLAYGCDPNQAVELAPDLFQRIRDGYNPVDILADQVPDLLDSLSTNGFRLAVVSNRREPFDEQLEALGIGSYFEYSLAAGTINAWKPDPAIFQYALTKMGIESEQAIYIGDNYFADVVGAHRAGMDAVLIDPENLFPEAECPVIEKISELKFILIN